MLALTLEQATSMERLYEKSSMLRACGVGAKAARLQCRADHAWCFEITDMSSCGAWPGLVEGGLGGGERQRGRVDGVGDEGRGRGM